MGGESNGTPAQPAPMKFFLSNPKPSAARPPLVPREKVKVSEDAVEYVTAFDEQLGVVAKDSKGTSGRRVIPKLENSWRPEKRMKNIMVEADITAVTEERFEMETLAAGPKPNVQYGLTVRVQGEGSELLEGDRMEVARPLSFAEMEEQKVREELLVLPEEASLDAYEDLPVEEFAEAMLRGMGWEKGKPIGRNAKNVIAVKEYVRRQGREGLGATPAPPKENPKKYIKPGETRGRKSDMVAPVGRDGRIRHVIGPDVKLVERVRKGVSLGKVMSVISGRHAGLRGEVLSTSDDGQVVIRFVKSGEKVVVNMKEVADIGSFEEEAAMKQMRELRIGNGKVGPRDERRSSRDQDAREDNRAGQKEGTRHHRRGDSRDDGERRSSREADDRGGVQDRREGRNDDGGVQSDERREGQRSWRREERRERKREERREKSGSKEEHDDTRDEMDVDDEGGNSSEKKRSKRRDESRDGRREERRDGRREEERSKNKQEEREVDVGRGRVTVREIDERQDKTSDKRLRDRAGQSDGLSLPSEQVFNEKRSVETRISYKIVDPSSADTGNRSKGNEDGGRSSQSWLMSHIRVRIISKSLHGGKLYLKKGRVIDVVKPKVCDVLLDDTGEMLQVKQDHLETALPKKGGRVVVVGGEYRSHIGTLLERDSEREIGIVEMEDSFEMVTLGLDLLAELVGDPSD